MIDEEAYDKIVREINKNMALGWVTAPRMWAQLGIAICRRQSARDQPIWGVREGYAVTNEQGREIVGSKPVALVANAWAFHPLATPIRDVTYDEAIALHKLKN
jgi:hypothetical protein